MFLSLIVTYLIPVALGKPISRRQSLLSKGFALFTIKFKDQLSGYDVIRSFQLSNKVRGDFARENQDISEKKYAVDRLAAVSGSLAEGLSALSQLLIMLVSGYFVLRGHFTAGVLLAILQLSSLFVAPVTVIMQNTPLIQGARPVLRRIQELSSEQESAFQGTLEPRFDEAVRFENVSFGYKPEQKVFDGLSLTIEKNKKYAVVGASGSGKTTLIKLLCAGYGSYTGSITVDGRELRELDIENLLAQISVIHQNVYMFDESIKDNIDLHRVYSEEEWRKTLADSGVDRFMDQMENGLDTSVGENGINLSGGQRQRIAVARALIQKKPFLILDEGTAAVDKQTAYEIETALLGTPDITMVTITHNLSPELLRQYDGIFFLHNGRVAETGSYDNLTNKGTAFGEFIQIKENQ